MIVHDVEQGTAEWFKLRCGLPTASEFDKIITPAKGELSSEWKAYAARLIWERLLNTTVQSLQGISHIEEGKRLEPFAVRQYEYINDVKTERVGFVTTDDGLIGASPDRFILGKQLWPLEIKCPTGPVHMNYCLFGRGPKYKPQIQGQLLVCEAEYGMFYSYAERAPGYDEATRRDDAYIAKMQAALREFTDNLQALTEKARAMGAYQAFSDIVTPLEAEHGPAMRRGLPEPGSADWMMAG